MSHNISALLGKKAPVRTYAEDPMWVMPHTHIGVELEMDGWYGYAKAFEDRLRYWEVDQDGSMDANGVELRLTEPLSGLDLSKALVELRDLYRTGRIMKQSGLGSTHIHIDMREVTLQDAIQILLLAGILEPLLFRMMGGEDREGLVFSLPTVHSYPLLYSLGMCLFMDSIPDKFSKADIVRLLVDVTPKYAATSGVHLVGGKKFGTLEFRQGRPLAGKQADVDDLELWINTVMCLKQAVLGKRNLLTPEWYRNVSELSPKELVKEVFGCREEVVFLALKHLPDVEQRIMHNLRVVEEAVFSAYAVIPTIQMVGRELDLMDHSGVGVLFPSLTENDWTEPFKSHRGVFRLIAGPVLKDVRFVDEILGDGDEEEVEEAEDEDGIDL